MNNKYCLFLALSLSFCVPSFANETFWTQLSEGRFDRAGKTLRDDPTVDVKWRPNAQARSAAAMVLAAGPAQADLLAAMWAKHNEDVETVSREEMLSAASGKSTKKIGLAARDEYGTTYMHWLCFSGSSEKIARRLKDSDYIDVADFAGDTPLHYAISGQNVAAVELLLSRKANLEAKNDLRETPLIRALATAHQVGPTTQIITIIHMLLEANAEVRAADIDGATPLHFAVLVKQKSLWLTKALLAHGADAHAVSRLGTTPLSNAASAGRQETLSLLESHAERTRDAKAIKVVIKVPKRVNREHDDSERVEEANPLPAKRPAAFREQVIDLTGPEFQAEDAQMRMLAAEVDAYLNRNVRNRDRVRFANGAEINVRVVGTSADGHCGFKAIGLDRQLFIEAMLEVYGNSAWYTERLNRAMAGMRGVKTIEDWAKAYAKILENGHAAVWLDQTHMELISAYFNIRFHIYIVDVQHSDGFIEQPGNNIVYEGQNPETATDFEIAYVALADGPAPLVHFERLEILPERPLPVAPAPLAQAEPTFLGANAVNMDKLNNMFQEFVAARGQQVAYAVLLGIQLGAMYGKNK